MAGTYKELLKKTMTECTVCLLFPKKKTRYGPIAQSLVSVANSLSIPVLEFSDDYTKYDHIILFYNRPVDLKLLPHQKVHWWMCDLRRIEELAVTGKYDTIFLCNKEYLADYKKTWGCKVLYLPQCGDDGLMPDAGRTFFEEVLFIGNFNIAYHKNRREIINAISASYPVNVIQGEHYCVDTKFLYNKAKYSLAISPQANGYTSNRMYNILSSGGFCLTLWFPGIEKLFTNHKHLVWFKTPEEAIDAITYYNNHPDEYQLIKKEGLKKYKRNHTALHRMKFMLKNMV